MRTHASLPAHRLQAADRRIGWLLCASLQPVRLARRAWGRITGRWSTPRPPHEARNVLLIGVPVPGGLQLLTPAATALRDRYPAARIHLLTRAGEEELAQGLGTFDEIIVLDFQRAGWVRLFGRCLRVAWRLARAGYDAAFDFHLGARCSALAGVAGRARVLTGFEAPEVWRGGFHDELVRRDPGRHLADDLLRLAAGSVRPPVTPDELAPFRVKRSDAAAVADFLAERLPVATEPRPLVALNPSRAELSPESCWPAERFGALARRLVDERGCDVVVVGPAGESELAARVVAASGRGSDAGRVLDLAGGLSLGELLALYARAEVLVTHANEQMHVAAALGTGTASILTREPELVCRALGERTRTLQGRRDVEVTVEAVFAATCELLASPASERPFVVTPSALFDASIR